MQNRSDFDSKEKIWSGPKYSEIDPNLKLGEVIINLLNENPDKISQINDNNGIELTNKDIKNRSLSVAQYLQELKLKQTDIISINCRNNHNLSSIIFGGLLSGMPINTLDYQFGKSEIRHMFNITKPKVIICESSNFNIIKEIADELNLNSSFVSASGRIENITFIEDLFDKNINENDFIFSHVLEDLNQNAIIHCSSGTTGFPKGACMTRQTVLTKLLKNRENLFGSNLFTFNPVSWVSGFELLILALSSGLTRIQTDETFSPELVLNIIEKYKIEVMVTSPSQLALILESPDIKSRDLTSVKMYACGGSVIPKIYLEKLKQLIENVSFLVFYSLTECGALGTKNANINKLESVGLLDNGVQMKIIDDECNSLNINECGEICIKTPQLFNGYYNNPIETKKILDSDGWLHSGDIGYFDDEGYLFVVDRKKAIFKYCSHQIIPAEIEDLILNHPFVVQVCVFPVPDLISTDLPAAAIIKKDNCDITEKEIYDFVAERASDYKKLRGGIYFLDSLPMTGTGKINRKKVQSIVMNLQKLNIK